MNSGPQAGLGEISLPALQPGSSIMPGKVNPVIPEAVLMACARVAGHDASVAIAGQSGNFQLNVMLPLVADALLNSIGLLSASCRSLAHQTIAGAKVNAEQIGDLVARNPILVTALNRVIGYDEGARIAKLAYAEGRSIVDVAVRESGLDRDTVVSLLDPSRLTEPDC
jgi:fumarate hydratase class II